MDLKPFFGRAFFTSLGKKLQPLHTIFFYVTFGEQYRHEKAPVKMARTAVTHSGVLSSFLTVPL